MYHRCVKKLRSRSSTYCCTFFFFLKDPAPPEFYTLPLHAPLPIFHLLPQAFVRIRHFGFLASRRRAKLLPLCFQLLGAAQQPPCEEQTSSTEDSPDLYHCPNCGGQIGRAHV